VVEVVASRVLSPTPRTPRGPSLRRDVVDELEHVDGLAHAGAANEADLAAFANGQMRSITLIPVSSSSTKARARRTWEPCGGSSGAVALDGAVVDGRPSTSMMRRACLSRTGDRPRCSSPSCAAQRRRSRARCSAHPVPSCCSTSKVSLFGELFSRVLEHARRRSRASRRAEFDVDHAPCTGRWCLRFELCHGIFR